jgi:hypothetical protein
MALSAFDDRSAAPDAAAIAAVLGRSAALWANVKESLGAEFGTLIEEWTFAGKAYGWSLRLKRQKRAIVYLTPRAKHFLASFALGEKACRAAESAGLAPATLALIEAAPRYPEGRGVRIEVRTRADVEQVVRLARVKMAN